MKMGFHTVYMESFLKSVGVRSTHRFSCTDLISKWSPRGSKQRKNENTFYLNVTQLWVVINSEGKIQHLSLKIVTKISVVIRSHAPFFSYISSFCSPCVILIFSWEYIYGRFGTPFHCTSLKEILRMKGKDLICPWTKVEWLTSLTRIQRRFDVMH